MGSGKRWKVATVRGIPLYVSTSWVFIVAFVVWIQYTDLADRQFVDPAEALTVSVVATILFFVSVLGARSRPRGHGSRTRPAGHGHHAGVLGWRHRGQGLGARCRRRVPGRLRGTRQHPGDGGCLLGTGGRHDGARVRRRWRGSLSSACGSPGSTRCRHSHSTAGACSSRPCGGSPTTAGPRCAPPAT